MLSLRYPAAVVTRSLELADIPRRPSGCVVCGLKGPRPRYPRVWKSRKKIGTISKSAKLVERIKGLSNVKEEVYGALDSFVAWELEFPLITVKKALKTLTNEREWKRVIQVTKWMLSKGQGKTMGSYYTLLNALAEDGRLEEAEELWAMIFSRHLEHLPREFYCKMISLYYTNGMHEKMFEVFADMEELGVKPNGPIVEMLGKVFLELGMMDKYEKLMKKYPAPVYEYRYFKGKRVRVRAKHPSGEDEETTNKFFNSVPQNGLNQEADNKVHRLENESETNLEYTDELSDSEYTDEVDMESEAQVLDLVHQNGVDEEANALVPEREHPNKALNEEPVTSFLQPTHQKIQNMIDEETFASLRQSEDLNEVCDEAKTNLIG